MLYYAISVPYKMEYLGTFLNWLLNVPQTWAFLYWFVCGIFTASFWAYVFIKDHKTSSLIISYGLCDDVYVGGNNRARNDGYFVLHLFIWGSVIFVGPLIGIGVPPTEENPGGLVWDGFSNWVFLKMILSGTLSYICVVGSGALILKTVHAIRNFTLDTYAKALGYLTGRKAKKVAEKKTLEESERKNPERIRRYCKDRVDEAHRILIKGLADTGAFLQGTQAILNLLDELLELLDSLNKSLPENTENSFL